MFTSTKWLKIDRRPFFRRIKWVWNVYERNIRKNVDHRFAPENLDNNGTDLCKRSLQLSMNRHRHTANRIQHSIQFKWIMLNLIENWPLKLITIREGTNKLNGTANCVYANANSCMYNVKYIYNDVSTCETGRKVLLNSIYLLTVGSINVRYESKRCSVTDWNLAPSMPRPPYNPYNNNSTDLLTHYKLQVTCECCIFIVQTTEKTWACTELAVSLWISIFSCVSFPVCSTISMYNGVRIDRKFDVHFIIIISARKK